MGAVRSVLGMSLIELSNVSIDYPLDHDDGFSFKSILLNGLLPFKKKRIQTLKPAFRALNKISLSILHGERVGIIGLNGAGKSTLLRVLAGIFQPTEGEVSIRGKVSPLLDFATGFELHHSGIENIRIRLMFLGESKTSIEEKIPEIAEFSQLGDFLHRPARTYSAGMFMRLAFATSTAINPEILIADEIVGTGDAQFSDKAQQRIKTLLAKNKTTILSSHSMDLIRQFCDRVIWLQQGHIVCDGATEPVISEYEHWVQKQKTKEENQTTT